MDTDKIQKLIELAKVNELVELTYKKGDEKIVVVTQRATSQIFAQQMSSPAGGSIHTSSTGSPSSNREIRTAPREQLHEVKSPLVGTFYSQAAPAEPSFVKIGDKVKKGQVVCILEAMKIMNEIESDTAGEVVEICVENESLVEFGQVLLRLRT